MISWIASTIFGVHYPLRNFRICQTVLRRRLLRDWLRLQLASLEREEFTALFLDNQHRLIAHETLFTGTINHTQVHPREVVKAALKHNAAAILVAHCHPSRHAEPSDADRRITERLRQALDLMDIRLLDHLVVGGMEIVSLAERGWL
ncbi:DNA repair protein RadC [Raoultella planticola]|uniref:RadC family protein n=1 Tax=Raoultella planticola TaxID=575 RepID=UPI00388EDEEB